MHCIIVDIESGISKNKPDNSVTSRLPRFGSTVLSFQALTGNAGHLQSSGIQRSSASLAANLLLNQHLR